MTAASANVAQPAPDTPSAKMHLSPVGRTLLPLIDGFPQGAGPVTQAQPLFVTAVLSLRAQAVAAAVVEPAVRAEASKPAASPAPAPPNAPASIDNASEASFLKPLSSALTQALMVVLKGQIVQSGLFYESHLLKQLQAGAAKLTPLEDEPQQQRPLPKADDLEVREELRPLVRQQLDLLAGQPIQWQGQVWPGATMRWEIFVPPPERDNDAQSQPEADTGDRACSTRIALELPTLGAVSARIRIAGPHVDIHLDVTDEGAILAERLSTLRETLESAGMRPGDITLKRVDHDDA
ncbi:flagellar hook-length control protein FliK, partial [Bordetella sp. 02P26C-1]|uniref:flagellar hook-length control protein FliK n=1 Tax=Bordetella sp. 02P26C-1 TaxID=2683195 RepID=UPI00135592D5